jgi:hypothetical protein
MPKDWFGRELVTVEELERMTPEERAASFEEALVTDSTLVPEYFRRRAHDRFDPIIAQRDRDQSESSTGNTDNE